VLAVKTAACRQDGRGAASTMSVRAQHDERTLAHLDGDARLPDRQPDAFVVAPPAADSTETQGATESGYLNLAICSSSLRSRSSHVQMDH
jgi:hypothetical protein